MKLTMLFSAPDAPGSLRARIELALFGTACLLCALSPLPHTTMLRNLLVAVALVLSLVVWVVWRKTRIAGVLGWSAAVLTAVLVVASLAGPYVGESLTALRKDFLGVALTGLGLALTANTPQRIRIAALSLGAGFCIRTMLVLIEKFVLHAPLAHLAAGTVDAYSGAAAVSAFYPGFALCASIYLPLTVAAIVLARPRGALLAALIALSVAGCYLTLSYGSRTPVIAISMALLVLLAATRSIRTIATLAVAGAITVAIAFVASPAMFERYASIVQPQTYTLDGDMTSMKIGDRTQLWAGVKEIGDARPLLGYGFGWKKLSTVARDEGYLEKWKPAPGTSSFKYTYFSRGYGGVNPHNLIAQMYFEAGMIGILALTASVLALAIQAIALYRGNPIDQRPIGILGLVFLSAWLPANIGNSLWAGEVAPFAVAGLLAAASSLRTRENDNAAENRS